MSLMDKLRPKNDAQRIMLGMGAFSLGAWLCIPLMQYSSVSWGFACGAFFATMWCAVLMIVFLKNKEVRK